MVPNEYRFLKKLLYRNGLLELPRKSAEHLQQIKPAGESDDCAVVEKRQFVISCVRYSMPECQFITFADRLAQNNQPIAQQATVLQRPE